VKAATPAATPQGIDSLQLEHNLAIAKVCIPAGICGNVQMLTLENINELQRSMPKLAHSLFAFACIVQLLASC